MQGIVGLLYALGSISKPESNSTSDLQYIKVMSFFGCVENLGGLVLFVNVGGIIVLPGALEYDHCVWLKRVIFFEAILCESYALSYTRNRK